MGKAARRVSSWTPPPPSPLSKEFSTNVTPPEQSSLPKLTMQEDTPTPTHPSRVNSIVKTYVPSPTSSSADPISQYMAKLSDEQRDAITELIAATKEPLSSAIDALIACEWDVLEAVAVFGGDARDENEDDDIGNDTDGVQEDPREQRNASLGTRSRRDPDVRHWWTKEEEKQLYEEYSTSSERVVLLRQRLYNHNQDWPQNPRNAVFEPITLQFSPSSPNTHTIPKFMSPYEDRKLWYTGFMGP
jgi:hypothetical protein